VASGVLPLGLAHKPLVAIASIRSLARMGWPLALRISAAASRALTRFGLSGAGLPAFFSRLAGSGTGWPVTISTVGVTSGPAGSAELAAPAFFFPPVFT